MYKITISTLRKLFTDSYNKGYAQATVNISKKSGEPVGNEKDLEDYFNNWVKVNLG